MCLTIRVEASHIEKEGLRQVLRSTHALVDWTVEGAGWLRRHSPRLALHLCDYLAEDADWDAATWSMRPEMAERLAGSLASLLPHLPGRVTVSALWEGEAATTTERITPGDLIEAARLGRLGTKTEYVISSG